MIGRQELIVDAAVLIVLVLSIWPLATLRRAKDQLAEIGAVLFIVGATLVFFGLSIIALVTLGIGLVVLAIRLPRPLAGDEDVRIPCPFCAEEIKPRALLCPHCRCDVTRTAAERLRPRMGP